MSDANHATMGQGDYCVHCASALGDAVKVQPSQIHDEPGKWCPRCWVWKRMSMESGPLGTTGPHRRFHAKHTVACKCQFCGWTVVSHGAVPGGGIRCSHCGKSGCIPLQIDDATMAKLAPVVRDALEAAKKTVAQSS